MKKIVILMSLISQLSQAANYDCKNMSGTTLKVETKEQMINAHWYGLKDKYAKVPTLIAHFQGTHASKLDSGTIFYYAQDLLSDLYSTIELEKYSKVSFQKSKKCHRGGCDSFPVPSTQYKATLHLSNTRFPHSFTCKKLN